MPASSRTGRARPADPDLKKRTPITKSGRRPRSDAEKFASSKAVERQRKQRARTIRSALIIAAAVVSVGLLSWGIWAFISSPIFEVKQVDVTGVSVLQESDVRDMLASEVDTTLFKVSSRSLEDQVAELPWVKSVEVKKRLPATISIAIVERSAAASVTLADGAVWIVSDDGIWLGAVASSLESTAVADLSAAGAGSTAVDGATAADAALVNTVVPDGGQAGTAGVGVLIVDPSGKFSPATLDTSTLIGILDVPNPKPTAGSKISSPEVLNAVAVLAGLDGAIVDDIARVSAPEVGSTTATTNAGVDLVIGSSDDIQVKSKVILSILKAHEGSVSLINVRTVDNPTWRGLEGR